MAHSAELLVSQAMTSLETISVPTELRHSVDQHQHHLLELAAALLAGGQDKKAVEHALDCVFSSYKAELVKTIMFLREDP